MFFIGILITLISTWYAKNLGVFIVLGIVLCLAYSPRSRHSGFYAMSLLWLGSTAWAISFLIYHMNVPYWSAFGIYSMCGLFCLSILWGIWYYIMPKAGWRSAYFLSIFCMAYISLPFMSCMPGVFFLNPGVPVFTWLKKHFTQDLVAYKEYRVLCDSPYTIMYFPPLKNASRVESTHIIYKKLTETSGKSGAGGYLLSPESFYPYTQTGLCDIWKTALSKNTAWIFGGTAQKSNKDFDHKTQALFLLQDSLITLLYEKKQLVDFFEGMPQGIYGEFFKKKYAHEDFFIPGTETYPKKIIPADLMLCIEFYTRAIGSRGVWLFCNETWLPGWVSELWKGYCIMRAITARVPLIWIGHTECFAAGLTIFNIDQGREGKD